MQNKLVIVAILALSGASALAGFKQNPPVIVSGNSIYGPMGTARASSDSIQYIGCELLASLTYAFATCSGRTSTGITFTCWTEDEALMKTVAAMTDGAYITFAVDAADPSECNYISVRTSSRYAPPVP